VHGCPLASESATNLLSYRNFTQIVKILYKTHSSVTPFLFFPGTSSESPPPGHTFSTPPTSFQAFYFNVLSLLSPPFVQPRTYRRRSSARLLNRASFADEPWPPHKFIKPDQLPYACADPHSERLPAKIFPDRSPFWPCCRIHHFYPSVLHDPDQLTAADKQSTSPQSLLETLLLFLWSPVAFCVCPWPLFLFLILLGRPRTRFFVHRS